MNIVFIAHRKTEHQIPLSIQLSKISNNYQFIETDSAANLNVNIDKTIDEHLICEADCVILGSSSEKYIIRRLQKGKLTFRYSERFYKQGFVIHKYIRNALASWLHHGRFQKLPLYMLCASAYTAADCDKFHNYRNKLYKWGYFPETRYYDSIDALINNKKKREIVWAARLIDWKHPEVALQVAKRLREEKIDFHLNIIGDGELKDEIKRIMKEYHLEDYVSLMGSVTSQQVRDKMEETGIFIFTSDFQEGWGAVLNEAMNSGCAVVASHAIGSVPFLIKDKDNGLIYKNGDIDDLYNKVKNLLDDPERQKVLGVNAYRTIVETWNAEVAAERFHKLSTAILAGDKAPNLYESGPCSKAEILQNDWYPIRVGL